MSTQVDVFSTRIRNSMHIHIISQLSLSLSHAHIAMMILITQYMYLYMYTYFDGTFVSSFIDQSTPITIEAYIHI